MAETIASNFPFAEFAARHFCSVNEVARALSAVVIAPLADPSFDWYDDDDLTIPTYAIVMMESWERHYQRALTANVEQVVSDDTTETSSSSSWDSDGVNGQYDGSFSESGSDVLTTRSGKSSTSSSGSSTGSGGHGNSPNNGISISATIFKIDCEGEDALNHHVQEGEDSDTIEDSHASDETSEGEMEEPTRVAVRDTEYKKRPKWMPVDRPRVHVYKDEWGAYVPVPTKEEKEEQERQQMLKEEARRIRRSRGRMKEDDSEELDMLELELEMALGENFGDQDLEVDQDLRRAIQDSYPPLGGVNLRGERVDENGVEWPPEYDLV
ncbi:hypothetical protein BDV59DRAFT_185283 [Aspergillus ambiguus]|uniref:uncharacterized protein n=1 Tax=Aspergillus ambiguus TaxID=176160 RepID=UPI003CCD639E